MIDQIAANRIVPASFDGNFGFGADAIGAGDENRLSQTGRDAEHSAKTAKPTHYKARECRLNELFDSVFCRVGNVDINAGASVTKRVVAHADSASSKATSLRIWRIRWSISARVTVSSRSIENFSTANDPSTEPKMTARRMFASLRSLLAAREPMNPTAKESPAPVGSNTFSRGKA